MGTIRKPTLRLVIQGENDAPSNLHYANNKALYPTLYEQLNSQLTEICTISTRFIS
jgi:hypothetical protein